MVAIANAIKPRIEVFKSLKLSRKIAIQKATLLTPASCASTR
ncbi:hypothetical protein PMAN_b0130 [Pseudoalteromonas marina]|nr:hypothetical protein PMAN_b0130 [Pseudoalteromonas marina]